MERVMQTRSSESGNRGQQGVNALSVASDLLVMNRDALAALVTLGARAGNPLAFVSDATDRFVVAQMLKQAEAV